jgi:hypothetical protein
MGGIRVRQIMSLLSQEESPALAKEWLERQVSGGYDRRNTKNKGWKKFNGNCAYCGMKGHKMVDQQQPGMQTGLNDTSINKKYRCYLRNKVGHFSKDCPERGKRHNWYKGLFVGCIEQDWEEVNMGELDRVYMIEEGSEVQGSEVPITDMDVTRDEVNTWSSSDSQKMATKFKRNDRNDGITRQQKMTT